MKFDKDTVAKHQFWFFLGGFLLLWFIAVLWLKVAASGPIEKAKKDYESQSNTLKQAQSNPINISKVLPRWQKEAQTFDGHKSKIWNEAWIYQADMYDWPREWASKDMTTPQTELSPDDLFNYKDKFYPQQINTLRKNALDFLYPVELLGGFDQIFKPQKWQTNPTREEVWLAQEDFWVKRELFYDIWRTMANLAFMGQPEEVKDKPEGVEASYRYRNQNWEITLNLRKNKDGQLVISGDSTIKNVDPTHRTQLLTSAKGEGIRFNVFQDQNHTEFEVRGEPVGWNDTRPFSMTKDNEREDYEPLDGIRWEQIKEHPITLSQGFDRTNSPIRRINAIALGKQDCRTYHWPLQPNQELAQLDASGEDAEKKAEAPPSGPSGPGTPGGGAMRGPPMGGPGGPAGPGAPAGLGAPGSPAGQAGAAAAPAANLTPNNEIERNRYLRPANQDKGVNPPSRHLPLALQLIIEQSHIHDVELALANSRLRIQLTQVECRHAKDYKPQEDEKDKKDGQDAGVGRVFFGGGMPGPGPMPPGMGSSRFIGRGSGAGMPGGMMGGPPPMMMPMPGMDRNRFRPTMAPGMRPSFPQAPGEKGTSQTAQNQQDDNLVEITLYGIATLYRRPDPPKTTEQPGQPGQPGQPAPPASQQQPTTAPASSSPQPGQTPAQKTPPPPAPQPGQTPPPPGQQPAQTPPPPGKQN
jgi:hypothetical protein